MEPIQRLYESFLPLLNINTNNLFNIGEDIKIPYLTQESIAELLRASHLIFQQQDPVVYLNDDYIVISDIHGNLFELLNIMSINGPPPKTKYLLLGDYIDRGEFSIETISLILILHCLFPNQFVILRGNHECREINAIYGFYDEIINYYDNEEIWECFNAIFDYFPIAAVYKNQFLCVHGGISPKLTKINELEKIKLPIFDIDEMVEDILWSDPTHKKVMFEFNKKRGKGKCFGQQAINKFLKDNDMLLLIRGHEMIKNGVKLSNNCKVLTVFSSGNLFDEPNAYSGYLILKDDEIQREAIPFTNSPLHDDCLFVCV